GEVAMDVRAQPAGERHLGQRGRHPAVRQIVRRADPAAGDQRAQELAVRPLRREIDRGRWAVLPPEYLAQPERLADVAAAIIPVAEEPDQIPFGLEGDGRGL